MVAEKSCNLSEWQVDLAREKESKTNWANLMNIYQSNTYRKDLSWLHLLNEPRAQEREQVKEQQP